MTEDAPLQNENGPGDAGAQPPPPDAQEHAPPPPRVPCTHTSPAAIQVLKQLPFLTKLKKNKFIEDKNEERLSRTVDHTIEPDNYPEPGSDAASLITLDEEDLSTLLNDTICDHCKDFLPLSVKQWLLDTKKARGESNIGSKRSILELFCDSAEKVMSRWRCMSGSDITLHVVGKAAEISFPDILFDMEMSVAVPLSFSCTRASNILINTWARLTW